MPASTFLQMIYDLVLAAPRYNPYTTAVSVFSASFLHLGREYVNPRFKRRYKIPLPLELFLVSTARMSVRHIPRLTALAVNTFLPIYGGKIRTFTVTLHLRLQAVFTQTSRVVKEDEPRFQGTTRAVA